VILWCQYWGLRFNCRPINIYCFTIFQSDVDSMEIFMKTWQYYETKHMQMLYLQYPIVTGVNCQSIISLFQTHFVNSFSGGDECTHQCMLIGPLICINFEVQYLSCQSSKDQYIFWINISTSFELWKLRHSVFTTLLSGPDITSYAFWSHP
jgi:hypothetical protein